MTQAVIQTTVTGMQGRPIATTAPAANQAYTWSGTAWAPTGPFLPLAGGILTGPLRLQYPGATGLIVNDTSTSITAGGLWRGVAQSGTFYIQSNTATAGDFSTAAVAFQATSTGAVTVGNGLTVNGNTTATGNINPSGSITAGGSIVSQSGVIQAIGGTVSVGPSGVFYLQDQPASGARILQWGVGWFDSWSSANGLRQWTNQNGAIMFLDGNGNLTISGVLAQGSDQTNKTNIAPLAAGISLVRQLLPKSFAWNTAPDVIHWGFIAQDVESVIPQAVSEMETTPGGMPSLSLDITAVVAAVTYAVKQIDQRLTAVEAHDGITPPAGALA